VCQLREVILELVISLHMGNIRALHVVSVDVPLQIGAYVNSNVGVPDKRCAVRDTSGAKKGTSQQGGITAMIHC